MNGFRLTSSVANHVVVASRCTPVRSGPSGRKLHSTDAPAASASSAMMPAPSMINRLRRDGSFQASVVSVHSTGHNTISATPMAGTRQPKRRAA
jgi:hypothetical protein